MPTWAERRRVFERVAAALRPGGRFAWNSFVFDPHIAVRMDGVARPHLDSLVQGAHDSTAVIAEFALRDLFAHSASVAPSATRSRSTSDACLTALRELIV